MVADLLLLFFIYCLIEGFFQTIIGEIQFFCQLLLFSECFRLTCYLLIILIPVFFCKTLLFILKVLFLDLFKKDLHQVLLRISPTER